MFAHYCILVFDEFLKDEKYWDLMDDEEVDEERALVFFGLGRLAACREGCENRFTN
jgi:hypothetical protein